MIETHWLGLQPYQAVWQQMYDYTVARTSQSIDQIWLVEHPPVYTLGRAGKLGNLLRSSSIPLIKTDRGGDITYHGPGQMVVYTLIDIRRANLGIRSFVFLLEESILRLLMDYKIESYRIAGRPGIYTNQGKIAALGLNCKKHGTYHGLSLNISVNKQAYQNINPCGVQQDISQLQDWLNYPINLQTVSNQWLQHFNLLWQPYQT